MMSLWWNMANMYAKWSTSRKDPGVKILILCSHPPQLTRFMNPILYLIPFMTFLINSWVYYVILIKPAYIFVGSLSRPVAAKLQQWIDTGIILNWWIQNFYWVLINAKVSRGIWCPAPQRKFENLLNFWRFWKMQPPKDPIHIYFKVRMFFVLKTVSLNWRSQFS